MSLIDKNLMPDETILFRTRKHLIIFCIPVLLLILALFFSYFMSSKPMLNKFDWAPALIAFLYFISAYLEYITAEFVVTNKRVVMREGFFNRHASELRINTISQINVEQGVIGQIFNFGDLSLNAFGSFDVFTLIANPFAFQKMVNEQLK